MFLKIIKSEIFQGTLWRFLLVQLIALFVGFQFIGQSVSAVKDSGSVQNSFFFFGYVIAFAVILLLVLKFYKGNALFFFFELLLIFVALNLVLTLFTTDLIAIIVSLLVIAARIYKPELQQPLLLIISGVVGALLGSSLDLLPAVILAILLSIYDIIAVFYTKHMVVLAKDLVKRGAAFSIKVKTKEGGLELGTGDLVMPAMLIVASSKLSGKFVSITMPINVWLSWHVILALLGACAGMALLFAVMNKKGYWPALPPLVFGTLMGIGVSLLF